jgi:hypothetical protein
MSKAQAGASQQACETGRHETACSKPGGQEARYVLADAYFGLGELCSRWAGEKLSNSWRSPCSLE